MSSSTGESLYAVMTGSGPRTLVPCPLARDDPARDDAPLRAAVALSPAGLDDAVHPESARAARVPVLFVLARDHPAAAATEVTDVYAAARAEGAVCV